MAQRRLRQMMTSPGLKVGHFVVEFVTPGIGHILKAAGCDFVFLDMEHSGFGFETVKSAIRYFEAADVSVIVRVPALRNDMLASACDVGAEGLIAPMISTPEQARAMVESIKYFPRGKRGVGLGLAHDNYRTAPVADALAGANERTCVICLIETAEGARNAEAIAEVKGVDCLWIGHFDLSVSLGIPGQFEHPDFKAAMDNIVSAARRHGKALGRLVANTEQGVSFYKQGFNFCCYSGDVWLLRDALTSAVNTLRKECE